MTLLFSLPVCLLMHWCHKERLHFDRLWKLTKHSTVKVWLFGMTSTDCYWMLLIVNKYFIPFFLFINRYLFNCGEGTQRIFNQHKLRLTRVNNIFFTRLCWEYIGGLPGMAMTLRDNGKSDIGLLGPSNLPQFIHATRFFLFHENLKSDCTEFTGREGEKYEDENLTIWPVLLSG